MSADDNLGSKEVWDAVMNDPVKRALILQLISKEKKGFRAATKRHALLQETRSPPNSRRPQCESPSALLRRRELLKLRNRNTSDSSSSEQSEVAEPLGPKLPFDQLLSGVVAFVEVRRKGVDRSAGIRALMRCMGATITETLGRGVTHVVFKDGTIATYQKAKLLKCHLVSILWLEAVRKHSVRVPEKNFPAFGGDDCDNISILCSQMQKDYEDVLKDEKRRSAAIFQNSTKISDTTNRRKTLSSTTPLSSATSSFQTASPHSPPTITNQEMGALNSNQCATTSFVQLSSPELTSDEESDYDSDCGVINGHSSSRLKKKLKSLDQTLNSSSRSQVTAKSTEDNSKSLLIHGKGGRKTINLTEDMVLTPNPETPSPLWNKSFEQLLNKSLNDAHKAVDSDKSTNISDESLQKKLEQSGALRLPSDLNITKDQVSSKTKPSNDSSSNPDLRKSGVSVQDSSLSSNTSGTALKKMGSVQSSPMSSFRLSSDANLTNHDLSPGDKENRSVNTLDSQAPKEIASGSRRSRRSTTKETFAIPKPVGTKDVRSAKRAASVTPDAKGRNQKNSSGKFEDRGVVGSVSRAALEAVVELTRVDDDQIQNDAWLRPSPVAGCRGETKTLRGASASKTAIPKKKTQSQNATTEEVDEENESLNAKTKSSLESSSRTDSGKSNSSITDTSRTSSRTSSPKKRGVRRNLSFASSTSNSSLEKIVDDVQAPISASPDEESKSKAKKMRKLYNPRDYSPRRFTTDDMERQRVMRKKKEECAGNAFVNPNNVMIIPEIGSKNLTKDINPDQVQKSLNKASSTSDNEKKVTKEKRKRSESSSESNKSFNSDDDEQKELLKAIKSDQLTTLQKSAAVPARRSLRISSSQKRINYRVPSTDSNRTLPISPITNRRSTLEFQSSSIRSSQKKKKKVSIEAPTIVCTKFHRNQVTDFVNIVKQLGVFRTEDSVSKRTTHLIAGEPKRTVNMLKAIAQGCWVLNTDWLLKSSEAGKWLLEEDFELTEFSPTVQQCRLERQAFGRNYTMDIFQNLGHIYIAKKTTPKQSELIELVELCKGKITCCYRNATIVVGEFFKNDDIPCVTTMWILDSITMNKLMPLKKYFLRDSQSPCF